MHLTTVSVIFVSNNILQGTCEEYQKHLRFLVPKLKLLQFEIKKVSILQEDRNSIASDLEVLTKLSDIILIISDPKNDCIFQALAQIAGLKFEKNGLISKNNGGGYQEVINLIPESMKLLRTSDLRYPVIYFQRIFILPQFNLEDSFTSVLEKHLQQYRKPELYSKLLNIHINGNKKSILEELDKLNVEVFTENNAETLTISIRSENLQSLVECEELLMSKLGANIISSCDKSLMESSLYNSGEKHILQALEDIEKCLCKFGPENVFMSFNGGKDCTVLLHLVLTVQKNKFPNHKKPLLCLYVRSEHSFKEQDDFIRCCETFYNLQVISMCANIKEALDVMLKTRPNLKACFMGTRRSDPYCATLKEFQMTDPDWPQIMRVSPLLDWHYCDIWDYLLYYKIPYCKLYDMGYTSLGGSLNTIKNPSLAYHDAEGREIYLPAYKMLKEAKERSGRNIQSKI